jgi:hypothetical protein
VGVNDTHPAAWAAEPGPDQVAEDRHIQGADGPDSDEAEDKQHADRANPEEEGEDKDAPREDPDIVLDDLDPVEDMDSSCGRLSQEVWKEIAENNNRWGVGCPQEDIEGVVAP